MSTVRQDADDNPPCVAPAERLPCPMQAFAMQALVVERQPFHRVFGALSFPVAPEETANYCRRCGECLDSDSPAAAGLCSCASCGVGCDCSVCENERAAAQSRYNLIRLDTFEGGPVELGSGIILAHPGGVTPTTVTNTASNGDLAAHTVGEMFGALNEVKRLVSLGRFDEARVELRQVARLTEEAQRWLE